MLVRSTEFLFRRVNTGVFRDDGTSYQGKISLSLLLLRDSGPRRKEQVLTRVKSIPPSKMVKYVNLALFPTSGCVFLSPFPSPSLATTPYLLIGCFFPLAIVLPPISLITSFLTENTRI